MTDPIAIGLASWIIQDGNYPEFSVGQKSAFALEFHASIPLLHVEPGQDPSPRHVHTGGAHYSVVGRCIHIEADWWVLDFGMLAYSANGPPVTYAAGDVVHGSIYLGVDPFFYFEDLCRRPDAPPLIYDWQVHQIEIQTAPLVQTGPRLFERDRTKLGWREIRETNAWQDGVHAEYVLHCAALSEPRHRLR
jgi:hypothetical protein